MPNDCRNLDIETGDCAIYVKMTKGTTFRPIVQASCCRALRIQNLDIEDFRLCNRYEEQLRPRSPDLEIELRGYGL